MPLDLACCRIKYASLDVRCQLSDASPPNSKTVVVRKFSDPKALAYKWETVSSCASFLNNITDWRAVSRLSGGLVRPSRPRRRGDGSAGRAAMGGLASSGLTLSSETLSWI